MTIQTEERLDGSLADPAGGPRPMWLGDVIREHADQAAYFRSTRAYAAGSRGHSLGDLVRVDERIDAHLDGLRTFADNEPESAVSIARSHGNAFVRAVVAFHLGRADDILAMCHEAGGAEAVVAAAGWVGLPLSSVVVPTLASGSATALRVAVDIGRVHRTDIGGILREALQHDDSGVRTAAFRSAFVCGRRDTDTALPAGLKDGNADVKAWAVCAAARSSLASNRTGASDSGGIQLGQNAGNSSLKGEVQAALVATAEQSGLAGDAALSLCVRLLAPSEVETLLTRVAGRGEVRRALDAAAAWGHPSVVPFVVSQLETTENARDCTRLAGWVLSVIVGFDPVREGLTAEPPAAFAPTPSDSPFERDIGLDPDARLPWPNVAKYTAAVALRPLAPEVRHLRGRPRNREVLIAALTTEVLAVRAYAAWDLACAEPPLTLLATTDPLRTPAQKPPHAAPNLLFNVRAPAFRQMLWLRALSGGNTSGLAPQTSPERNDVAAS